MLDRLDVTLDTRPVDVKMLAASQRTERPSAYFRDRVEAARDRQMHRFRESPGVLCNAHMGPRLLHAHTQRSAGAARMLELSVLRFKLSARAHDRILKMARSRADLEGHDTITDEDMQFAIGCRVLDRDGWLDKARGLFKATATQLVQMQKR